MIVLIVIALTKGDDKYILSCPSSRVPFTVVCWTIAHPRLVYIFLEEGTLCLATSSKVEVLILYYTLSM